MSSLVNTPNFHTSPLRRSKGRQEKYGRTTTPVTLVTGAARGIGAAVASSLAGPGVRVAAVGILTEDLAGTESDQVTPFPADLSVPGAAVALVERVERELWHEDGLRPVTEGSPDDFRVGIPLRRIASPSDIADAVLFLVSEQARHITMHNLYVDGGATLRA